MSTQLHQAFVNILAMPYFKNDRAQSGITTHGHEDAVASKLSNASFQEEQKTNYPLLSKGLLRNWSDTGNETELRNATINMPLGTYITQPAGSQGFPDILVRDFNDRFIAIECKSGKLGECPMWNDNVPKPNSIYVLSSGAQNATTVFMGKDVISQDTYDLFKKQEEEIDLIVQKYHKLMSNVDIHKRGWIQKSRKQHFQSGGGSLTNYFTHKDRVQCEQNVLTYAQQ